MTGGSLGSARMALAAAVGAAFLLVSAHAAVARDLPGEPYGMVASNASFVPGDTVAERTEAYRRLRDAGVRAIRLDINWVQVEPPGEPLRDFDFEERDREVRAIRRAGLRVIGLLAYGHPDYSRRGAFLAGTPAGGGIPPFYVLNAQYFPPDDPRDFARYARATARHYGDEVIAWEIWNEQNEGWRFWPPREQPAAYARLLCAAHEAVRDVDPRTPVVYGGLFFSAVADLPGMSAPRFLQATYDANPRLGRCYEAMAYHPYSYYPYPFTAPELDVPIRGSVLSAADQMRAVLERNGDGEKSLWITEIGWPTHDRSYGVSERKQAQYVARMQAATFAQRLPVLTWYTYGDSADPTGGLNQEAWFGFFRPDGSAKPAHAALRTFARVFRKTRFARDRSRALGLPPGGLVAGGRGFALEYRGRASRRGERVTAVWLANESVLDGQGGGPEGGSLAPERVRVQLPVRSKRLRIVDYVGNEERVRARRGSIGVEAGPGPVYVIDRQ